MSNVWLRLRLQTEYNGWMGKRAGTEREVGIYPWRCVRRLRKSARLQLDLADSLKALTRGRTCLCFGLILQRMKRTPCRLTLLQPEHIFLTELRTFMPLSPVTALLADAVGRTGAPTMPLDSAMVRGAQRAQPHPRGWLASFEPARRETLRDEEVEGCAGVGMDEVGTMRGAQRGQEQRAGWDAGVRRVERGRARRGLGATTARRSGVERERACIVCLESDEDKVSDYGSRAAGSCTACSRRARRV